MPKKSFNLDDFLTDIILGAIAFLAKSAIKIYALFIQKDYYNRRHLVVSWTDGKLKIDWQEHGDYVDTIVAELERVRRGTLPDEFITAALKLAKGCNFVTFDCGNRDLFIQFWLAEGKLMVDWPITKENKKLAKHTYAMLGVLNEMNITQKPTDTREWFWNYYQSYKHIETSNFEYYQIYFGKEYQDAARFVVTVLTKVFGHSLKKLNARLG